MAGDATIAGPATPTSAYNGAGSLSVRGDLFFTGTNQWILHTPNDGRTELYLAPGNGDWSKQTRFDASGDVAFSQKVSIGDVSCTTANQCSGNLGINNLTLAVGGKIGARGGVCVVNYGGAWPDYVFGAGYRLRPLSEVARFIALHRHLPDVPSAAEVAGTGVELTALSAALLRQVEELTLRLIEQEKTNQALAERLVKLEATH